MNQSHILIFVEGRTDRRFFETVFAPRLRGRLEQRPKFIEYATGQSCAKLCRMVDATVEQGLEYLVVADLDDMPCCGGKRSFLCSSYASFSEERVVVAAREIEAWYLAGVDQAKCAALGISGYRKTTDRVDKAEFDRVTPRRFRSRIDFMNELLKVFDLDFALKEKRNRSLSYCVRKLGLADAT